MNQNLNELNDLKLESLYLKIFKWTVLSAMTLAIVAIPIMLIGAGFFYIQSPKSPPSIEDAVNKNLNIERLKQDLIETQRLNESGGASASPKAVTPRPSKVLQYNEDALAIYKCGDELKQASGATVQMIDSAQMAQQVEQIRSTIERLSLDPQKGVPYVKGISAFTCKVLRDPSIAVLKRDGKIGQVLIPTLNIYTDTWNAAEKSAAEFNATELIRVGEAKLLAVTLATFAFYLFLGFMGLALYLMLSRIENHFANINESILEGVRKK
jgi:hypothetical protein